MGRRRCIKTCGCRRILDLRKEKPLKSSRNPTTVLRIYIWEMATNAIESIKIEDEVVEVEGVGDKSVWSKKNEAIFIEIMEEEVISLGSRETGTFQKESWPRMRKALTARTSYPYTELQLRNKFNLLHQLLVIH
ncbi:hypothetical protein Vadar_027372 [Vaccinium darrowii]|uniref:Uncharacterized protein n=1 Tax=Vaccinium darrowii TaxID=229202 RepID=A0ACB7ZER1_9ERIC|nr:hypothetical protein Vadar_027372 [Vaccinium darrowii]